MVLVQLSPMKLANVVHAEMSSWGCDPSICLTHLPPAGSAVSPPAGAEEQQLPGAVRQRRPGGRGEADGGAEPILGPAGLGTKAEDLLGLPQSRILEPEPEQSPERNQFRTGHRTQIISAVTLHSELGPDWSSVSQPSGPSEPPGRV